MEWVEIAAPSVDEAREIALDRLGVTASEIELEVLAEPTKALFGLRRTDARIRARVKPTAPPAKVDRNDRRRGQRGASKRNKSAGKGRSSTSSKSGPGRHSDPVKSDRPAKKAGPGKGQRKDDRPKGKQSSKQAGPRRSNKADAVGRNSTDEVSEQSDSVSRRTRKADQGRTAPDRERSSEQPGDGDAGNTSRRTRTRRLDAPEPPVPLTAPPDTAGTKRIRKLDTAPRSVLATSTASTLAGGTDNNHNNEESAMTEELTLEAQGELVCNFLDGLVESFGLSATSSVASIEDDWIDVAVNGEGLGLLIGPGGRTLSALAEVAKTSLQRHVGNGQRGRVRVDVGGYREYRREALVSFTQEAASGIVESGVAKAFEPMGATDRKIVHDAASEIDGVSSISEGDEPRRRVVLVPAGD